MEILNVMKNVCYFVGIQSLMQLKLNNVMMVIDFLLMVVMKIVRINVVMDLLKVLNNVILDSILQTVTQIAHYFVEIIK